MNKLIIVFCLYLIASVHISIAQTTQFADNKLSIETKELYHSLQNTKTKGFLIGHQDAAAYGVGWNGSDHANEITGDVFKISGKFPAIYGFDIGGIENGEAYNLDDVSFERMKKLIIDAYAKGGVITISWHADHPITQGDSWDQTPAVRHIISGGKAKEKYDIWLSRVAEFIKTLEYDNRPIPIIFRPFHEMNGAWFWWGDPHCTSEEYIQLWKETFFALTEKHQLHNLLYTYSPNKLNPDDAYLKYYPGDDFVDILGIDIYDFKNAEDYVKSVKSDLALVASIAHKKNKLFAFTETGLEQIPTKKWYSEVLYPAIEDSGISWVLFWRNFSSEHHYVPYPGHPEEADFQYFEQLPKTLFLEDINPLNH
ncbi:glycoside hydrolase family 26 protein [Namhaeicola litoreus]|uniref:Mannan endo-1,4-beta-mannosidase n=1 Tax=Namhaeicola litoreus TaxID=1052145 RepID=A0ABW3Y0T1_9FLAO